MERVNAQPTFTDAAVADLGSPQARAFFDACLRYIDFRALAGPLMALFRNNTVKGGAPHYACEMMLKILFIQKVFGLSDTATEQMLLDRISFRRFVGLSFDDKTPDHSTIWQFRERLLKSGQASELFDRVVADLRARGVIVNRGTLIDATIIQAPLGRTREDGSRTGDPCASKTVKNGRPFHGYRAHFATDRNGFLTDYVFDTASTSEHAHFDHLARNETSEVYADSGCRSEDRIRAHRKRGVKLRFVCRRVRGQAELTRWQKRFNRAVSQVRAFVEHPLARIKSMLNQNGKARYRTMRRNATDFCLSATVTNLCRSLFHLKSATA